MRDLLAGMAVALAAGLMGGAAMRPQLNTDDLKAPQLITTAQVDEPEAEMIAYPGQAPDYVYGTDWKTQTTAYASAEPIHEAAYIPPEPPIPETTARESAPSAYDATDDAVLKAGPADAPSPVAYPSIAGGEAYPAVAAPAAEVG